MKAVRVSSIFGYDWKEWNRKYTGYKHEVLYNGVEYLPLDIVKDRDYLIFDRDIEDIKCNDED